ncbi:PREDICTED: fructokinase-like 2, chloroplastic [Nicotiana attenuata]|uniref:Fructokinase-like 2, chloroplastic n=1 Tax=Nicotiana attenuata TaxID=49451 RepID=A0A314KNR6_NICAT|nr:PREDICTED: fructokinase-like 2, chloroplastic [Nicotiana attenuata]OIT30815.1 fructokinase-like 2, chloroplastic [Nicotiana attenuata]
MAALSFSFFSTLPRQHLHWNFYPNMKVMQLQDLGHKNKWVLMAISKEGSPEAIAKELSKTEVFGAGKKTARISKRTPVMARRKKVVETSNDDPVNAEEAENTSGSTEEPKKTQRRTRKKKEIVESSFGDSISDAEGNVTDAEAVTEPESSVKPKKTRRTRKKKETAESTFEDSLSDVEGNVTDEEALPTSGSSEGSMEVRKRTSKKAVSSSSSLEKEPAQKVTRRRRKKVYDLEDEGSQTEISDIEEELHVANIDADSEEELDFDGGEDISFSYGWPPLVCCFGAAQHAFVPSGRPSNRLIDHEWHERMKDAIWDPEKFTRSPGGCSSNVAVALASLGGKVAFMGKLGDDDFGQSLVYFMNINKVQTRSVRLDSKKATAITHMKIGKRGGLRMSTTKPSAEDSLLKSEINIDVLKEAKMFYFNTFSLLDPNMRLTTLRATKISKKLGGVVFYDVNLPFPLWESGDKAKTFIQQAWDLADIIEVTKQELEFLCGIKPSERFDTKDNDRSKFTHYPPEVIAPLWHENLKVLFVTNGTSKIHYYTKEHNGAVLGLEDVPLTPYTSDMSASGDGIIAGIIRMLTVQPHLMTDKGYLERTLKYAISCGVVDQWLQARRLGYPPKEGMEDDVVPDDHGIKSVTEREYRTLVPIS